MSFLKQRFYCAIHLVTQVLAVILVTVTLNSCSGGSQKAQSSVSIGNNTLISLSQVAPFTISDDRSHTLVLQLNNNSSNNLSELSLATSNYSGAPLNVSLKAMNCTNVAAGGNCLIAVTIPPVINSGSFAVTAYDDQHHASTAFVNYTKTNTATNILNLGQLSNPIMAQASGNVSAVLPVLITPTQYEYLSAQLNIPSQLSSQFFCEGARVTSLRANQLCQVLLTTNVNSGNFNIELMYSPTSTLKTGSLVQIDNSLNPNVLIGGNNVVINPANGSSGTASITLLNAGLAIANNLNVQISSPLSISNNSCNGNLAVDASCSFDLHATSQLNGQSNVIISYQNPDGTLQTQNLNAIYIANNSSTGAQISVIGSFNSTILNTPSVMTLNISNNGNRALNKFNFSQLNILNPYLSYTTNGIAAPICKTDGTQDLPSGSSCNLGVVYNPTLQQNGTFNWGLNAEYAGATNQSQSYNSSITIPYSTVDTLNVGYSNNFVTLTQGESAVVTVTESSPLSAYPVIVTFTSPDPTNLTISPATCTLTSSTPSCNLTIITILNSNPNSYVVTATTGSKSLNSLYINVNKRMTLAIVASSVAKQLTTCNYSGTGTSLSNCVISNSGVSYVNLAYYESYIYTGAANGSVVRCILNPVTKVINSCTTQITTSAYGFVIQDNRFYYADTSTVPDSLHKCIIESTNGTLINCITESAVGIYLGSDTPNRLVIGNNILYISKSTNGTNPKYGYVIRCQLDQLGDVYNCGGLGVYPSTTSGVTGRGIAQYNQYFYFVNSSNNLTYISKYLLSADGLSVTDPMNATEKPISTNSSVPLGIIVANNNLFVNYNSGTSVFGCDIRESDGFLTCFNSGATGFNGSNNIIFW